MLLACNGVISLAKTAMKPHHTVPGDALAPLRIVVINTVEPPGNQLDDASLAQAEAAERARALRIGLLQA
ncbi:MAG: hypothetical protein RL748_1497, partial [Pseudomonadota bacterium]